MRSRTRSLLGLCTALALIPAAAAASFHEVKIVEVFPGTRLQPNAQYVVLQAWAANQNFENGHSIVFYDHTGAMAGSFTFDHNMANAANQMKMFIATPEAATLFNLPTVDLSMTTPAISPLGGKICWDTSNFDCVAWGNYTGSATGVGTPFNAPVGLELGQAAKRRLDICMGPTTLESCDDTDDSANDFVAGAPTPMNNAGTAGTPPTSTCGNLLLEGLEECDDGNTTDGDGCSAVCRWEPDKVVPTAINVDGAPGAQFFNGVLEPGEGVPVDITWQNLGAGQITLTGTGALFVGPAGATYSITHASADYGTVDPGAVANCQTIPCYVLAVSAPAVRPAQHWDTTFTEVLSTDSFAEWTLHVGDSFPDVPDDNIFYFFIENLFHNGVTGGCSGGNYCPTNPVTRAQMAVFLLKAKNGAGYTPPACTGTVFTDVPCTGGPFDPWIEDLAAQQITGGCGGGLYCPDATVTRKQMAVFLLKAHDGSSFVPPACTGVFADVPCTPGTGFSDWIEELYNRQITGGCSQSPLNYCPDNPNNRGQMAVFLVKTFGLLLYAPPI